MEQLLSPAECRAIAGLYPKDEIFRSRVVMGRHGFGRGEYKYFDYPLPDLLGELRTALYPHLVPIANHWNEAMGIDARYPEKHADFVERCHNAGQVRPTLLLLQYGEGTRGTYRVNLRHGVSHIRSGHRHTVGIIFHDAA